MQITYFIRKDDNLLKLAQSIFGDLVVEAYLCSERRMNDKEFSKVWASKNFDKCAYKEEKEGEMVDDLPILLRFSNGRLIELSGSEWYSIKFIDAQTEMIEV